jgi:hypothetical protein
MRVEADGLFLSTGLVAFLVAGCRVLLRVRGRRKPTEIPLTVLAFVLGVALVVLAPAVQAVESAILPSLGRLLSNICTLVAAFCVLHVMLYVRHPPEQVPARMRRRLAVLLVAVGLMTVMFLLSRPPAGTGIFTGLYRSQPTLATYTVVFSGYLGSATLDLGILAARSIRYTRIWLRLGMIFMGIGCVLTAGYLTEKMIGVVDELVTGRLAGGYCRSAFADVGCTFAVGMPALSALAIVLGAVVPILGQRLEHVIRDIGRRRSYQRLGPLWNALHEAMPNIALVAPDFPYTPAPGEISERLYQRVVAIRDGLLALQPYRDPVDTAAHHAQARAAGLPEHRHAPAVEAADIHAALRRRQGDELAATDVTSTPASYDDLDSEIRWLTRVSSELARKELPGAQHATSEG